MFQHKADSDGNRGGDSGKLDAEIPGRGHRRVEIGARLVVPVAVKAARQKGHNQNADDAVENDVERPVLFHLFHLTEGLTLMACFTAAQRRELPAAAVPRSSRAACRSTAPGCRRPCRLGPC